MMYTQCATCCVLRAACLGVVAACLGVVAACPLRYAGHCESCVACFMVRDACCVLRSHCVVLRSHCVPLVASFVVLLQRADPRKAAWRTKKAESNAQHAACSTLYAARSTQHAVQRRAIRDVSAAPCALRTLRKRLCGGLRVSDLLAECRALCAACLGLCVLMYTTQFAACCVLRAACLGVVAACPLR